MKTAVALKWADDLESGKYKQGEGYLRFFQAVETKKGIRQDPKHCCLGVLADTTIIGKKVDGVELAWVKDDWLLGNDPRPGETTIVCDLLGSDGMLEAVLLKKTGLNPEWQDVFIKLNDGGYSFSTIAKVIRKYAKVLGRKVPKAWFEAPELDSSDVKPADELLALMGIKGTKRAKTSTKATK